VSQSLKFHSKTSLRPTQAHKRRIPERNRLTLGIGLRIDVAAPTAGRQAVEVVEMIDVLSKCDPGIELGWEAGESLPLPSEISRNMDVFD
jgi:hypothetical protein